MSSVAGYCKLHGLPDEARKGTFMPGFDPYACDAGAPFPLQASSEPIAGADFNQLKCQFSRGAVFPKGAVLLHDGHASQAPFVLGHG